MAYSPLPARLEAGSILSRPAAFQAVRSLGLLIGLLSLRHSRSETVRCLFRRPISGPAAPSTMSASRACTVRPTGANLVAALADLGASPGTIWIDSAAGPSACSASTSIDLGAYHRVQFVDGNIYVLNKSIILGVGDVIEGVGGGSPLNPPLTTGTVLKWTGSTGTPVVRFWDASFSHLRHIGIDCNSTASCIGIHMDSDNNPITTRNVLENFEVTGSHLGVVIGSTSTSAVSGASCASNFNQSGCSENDFVTINNFQIFGNCSDPSAEGFRNQQPKRHSRINHRRWKYPVRKHWPPRHQHERQRAADANELGKCSGD